jgi:hypothetical protein
MLRLRRCPRLDTELSQRDRFRLDTQNERTEGWVIERGPATALMAENGDHEQHQLETPPNEPQPKSRVIIGY